MDRTTDLEKTAEIIKRMSDARIGKHKRWESMIKKIKDGQELNPGESAYYSEMTRIYKGSVITPRSRVYHTRLSELDEKPPCKECGKDSLYYCNMNDQYFCTIHVTGHDENEF